MRRALRIQAAAAVVGAIVAGTFIGVQPASATTRYGCSWPRVCFYLYESDWNSRTPTAAYQDRGYWQTLGPRSEGSTFIYNSRNDDGALLQFEDGFQDCLEPNTYMQLTPVYQAGHVTRIKIVDSPNC